MAPLITFKDIINTLISGINDSRSHNFHFSIDSIPVFKFDN